MRLLLDESLATLPVAETIRAGLAAPDLPVEIQAGLKAAGVGPTDAALINAGEYGALQETHQLLANLAVVFDKEGPVMMRTPVRPDEVEQTPIRLIDASSSAELLARATINSFFGIMPEGFLREDVPDSQAVVVEGAMALTPAEAGFNEDLTRAWFILTSEAYVSHVLAIPIEATEQERAVLASAADALKATTIEHRREVRTRIVQSTGLDRDRLTTLFQATRWSLEPEDRRALLMLLQLGNKSRQAGPYVSKLQFAGEE
jgi:predicted solute-binding protein